MFFPARGAILRGCDFQQGEQNTWGKTVVGNEGATAFLHVKVEVRLVLGGLFRGASCLEAHV